MFAVARLAAGVTIESARAELNGLIDQWGERVPDGHSPHPEFHRLQLEGLRDQVIGDVRASLLLLLGAVGFVLLIACANVGNLLLARAETRQKEIAVRTALGAGRGRLIRQFLTESLLLSVLGGAAGLLLGTWGLRALLATSPDSLPRVGDIRLDASVLAVTLGLSLLTGVLFELTPLLHMTARNLATSLRDGGGRSTSGSAKMRLRSVLVAAEIALAVVLVIGAGLMLRSFSSLQQVDPGFDPEGLLTFRLFLPPSSYPDGFAQQAFFDGLLEDIGNIGGVTSVTAMSGLPPQRRVNANDMEFEGLERSEDGPPHNVDFWQFVGPGYFETMEIELVEGRFFDDRELGESAQPAALVNQELAGVFYPGESPLGRRMRPGGPNTPWLSIIGVVADVKQAGLEQDTGTETYFYAPQVAPLGFAPRTMNVIARTSVPPGSISEAARQAVWRLDPTLPLADLQTMGDVLFKSVAQPRFLTLLLAIFGGVALALATVGTYGVMSYSVAERNHELGIRMALGAESGGVVRLVLGQGLGVALIGLVLGVVTAYGLTRFMSSMLFTVGTTDLFTFVAVPLLLIAVATLACLVPARRATRVDPMVVLRE